MKKIYFSLITLVLMTGQVLAQRTVSGKVTDDTGEGLPGVNVVIKGTTTGVTTDIDGNYQISVPDDNTVLVFSSVGMTTQEIGVGNRTVLDVGMYVDTQQLEEVVVTGYTSLERKKSAAAYSSIDAAKVENVPMTNFDQMLQGLAPGLQIQAASGQPGSSATITLRGINSINSSTTPLFVLDGVPVSAAQFETLNPNDFENVTVLKDAAAVAVYGSRGANGVIVITSKRGKAGKTQFNYSVQYGVSPKIAREEFLPVMNTAEKIEYELYTGGTSLENMTEAELDELRKTDTDWFDVLFQDGTLESHQISASGGNENATYYVSGGYLKQEGNVLGTGFERYTAKMTLNNENGNFRFGTSINLAYSELTNAGEGSQSIYAALNTAYWSNPYYAPYDENGDFTNIATGGTSNGLATLKLNRSVTNDIRAVVNVNMAYDLPFLEGLTASTRWGVDYLGRETDQYTDPNSPVGNTSNFTGNQGGLTRTYSRNPSFIGTSSLSYTREIGDHEFTAGLYHEMIYAQSRGFNFTGFGITGRFGNENDITGSAAFLPTVGGSGTSNAMNSYFLIGNYGFRNKYFLNASIRNDASSRFGPDNRNAMFWSVGGSWSVSDETFLSGVSVINSLQLRASYGTAGNQTTLDNLGAVIDFPYLSSVNTGATYNGRNALFPASLPNNDLGWEEMQSFNVGLDFGVLTGRLTGSVDYYVNDTKDLLIDNPLSLTTGFASQIQNVGEIRNSGVEVALNSTNIQNNDFSWTTGVTFSNNKNEFLSLPNGNADIVTGSTIYRVGEDITSIYVVPYLGVNPANGEPLYLTADGEITQEFSDSDRRITGVRQAPTFGSFTNTLSYKGFTVSVLFNWLTGRTISSNERANIEFPLYKADGLSSIMLTAWKQPGDITSVPRVETADGSLTRANVQFSGHNRWHEKGDYLRLRNLTVSYDLPRTIMDKVQLNSARVYFQGQNLWTLTEYSGPDPEDGNGNFPGAIYPAMRTYTVGLNIGF